MAMPLILKDPPENLIAQAQSGSGKTVAFCLGILNRIDTSRDCPQAIVVTPTRELAVQCYEQTLLPLGQFMQPKLKVTAAAAAAAAAVCSAGYLLTVAGTAVGATAGSRCYYCWLSLSGLLLAMQQHTACCAENSAGQYKELQQQQSAADILQPVYYVLMALGGTNLERGRKVTEHVVVGTTGKAPTLYAFRTSATMAALMEDWLKRGTLDARTVRVFVLDEADNLMTGQFGQQILRIAKYMSGRPQRLLFSATFPPEVLELAKRAIPKPINEITLASNEELMLEEIYQCWIDLRHDGANGRVELLRVSTSPSAAAAAVAVLLPIGAATATTTADFAVLLRQLVVSSLLLLSPVAISAAAACGCSASSWWYMCCSTVCVSAVTLSSLLQSRHPHTVLGLTPAIAIILCGMYELMEIGQSIVFCSTKNGCDAVTAALQAVGFGCSNLHGGLKGEDRDACMDDFRFGRKKAGTACTCAVLAAVLMVVVVVVQRNSGADSNTAFCIADVVQQQAKPRDTKTLLAYLNDW
eukprot:7669-Heterococcus_DN1.PRE.3